LTIHPSGNPPCPANASPVNCRSSVSRSRPNRCPSRPARGDPGRPGHVRSRLAVVPEGRSLPPGETVEGALAAFLVMERQRSHSK
jgi:hypothetical protein